ncbi:MAG: hypothetical protein OER92_09160 [Alphaproteobacteria bacterium]|nr:hypothetical protein [Alphaproteobacteria bacterium]
MSHPLVDTDKISVLRHPKRVWAVASVHGEVEKLARIHQGLAQRYLPGDRLVYLGNIVGRGGDAAAAIDQVLSFRRAVIATQGMFAGDVAFLRGAQEEMWQKLLQLQLALNPVEVLTWMLDQGVDATLTAYGGNAADGLAAARSGAAASARWTAHLRDTVQTHRGHTQFLSALRRAAVTAPCESDGAVLLFVNSGLDVSRPLAAQKDSYWWPSAGFDQISEPYGEFSRIVRGFDKCAAGLTEGLFTVSVDAGAGRGGELLAACLDDTGAVVDILEA